MAGGIALKKSSAMRLAVIVLLLCVGGCSSINTEAPEPAVSRPHLSDSMTYLKVNGWYAPLSCMENGVQMLNGGVGPYSILMDTVLKDALQAEELTEIDVPKTHVSAGSTERDTFYGLGPIASNGDWEFYPNEVSHEVYPLDCQPDQPDWADFFKEELEKAGCDSPIVIRESFSFQWEGLKTSVVTASNVLFSPENSDKAAAEAVCQAAVQPKNSTPNIYEISALFVEGRTPETLFQQAHEIPKEQKSRTELGIAYIPWGQNFELYTQYLSAVQYDDAGEPSIFPIFCDFSGEHIARDFKHLPQFVICDLDGDGRSELVMNITRTSSLMCFSAVYQLDDGTPVCAMSLVLN